MTLKLNFYFCKKLLPNQIPTRIFELEFGMQGFNKKRRRNYSSYSTDFVISNENESLKQKHCKYFKLMTAYIFKLFCR